MAQDANAVAAATRVQRAHAAASSASSTQAATPTPMLTVNVQVSGCGYCAVCLNPCCCWSSSVTATQLRCGVPALGC